MARDRFTTRAAIIASAASLIAANGVDRLGVNALAEAAQCDKVLIYRYFGGLDGVLQALAAERMLWPKVAEQGNREGGASLGDAVREMLLEEWAALSEGALMLQAAAAEASGASPLGAGAGAQRAVRHAEIVASLRASHRVPPYIDLAAILELLSAALTLFALRASLGAPHSPEDSGAAQRSLDPSTPDGWRRIEKLLTVLTRSVLD